MFDRTVFRGAPRPEPYRSPAKPPAGSGGGVGGLLRGILPAGLEPGDLLLLGILLLLYLDSKDEDFLIILAVMALTIFRQDGLIFG